MIMKKKMFFIPALFLFFHPLASPSFVRNTLLFSFQRRGCLRTGHQLQQTTQRSLHFSLDTSTLLSRFSLLPLNEIINRSIKVPQELLLRIFVIKVSENSHKNLWVRVLSHFYGSLSSSYSKLLAHFLR